MGRYSNKYKSYYDSTDHKHWRRLVMLRANYLCQFCKTRGIVTAAKEAHHIKPIESNWKLRTDIDNGVALCKQCHNDAHDRRSELQKFMENR